MQEPAVHKSILKLLYNKTIVIVSITIPSHQIVVIVTPLGLEIQRCDQS